MVAWWTLVFEFNKMVISIVLTLVPFSTGIAIPNRSDTGQNDVKKPVRYGKKKPKSVKEKSEVIEAEKDSVVGNFM